MIPLLILFWAFCSAVTYYMCHIMFGDDITTDDEEWAALCVAYLFWWMILPAILVVMFYRGLVLVFGKFHDH